MNTAIREIWTARTCLADIPRLPDENPKLNKVSEPQYPHVRIAFHAAAPSGEDPEREWDMDRL
jgi:hypothetical protein